MISKLPKRNAFNCAKPCTKMWSHEETLPEQRIPEPQLDHFERMPKYV